MVVTPPWQGSLRVTDNGSFNVYSKSQEYRFTPDGLVRKQGRRAVHPVDSQLSYKVRQSVDADPSPCTTCPVQIQLSASRAWRCKYPQHAWWPMQISEKDVRIVKVLGRGASSVVSSADLGKIARCAADCGAHANACMQGCGQQPFRFATGSRQNLLHACMLLAAIGQDMAAMLRCAGLQGIPGALWQVCGHQKDQLL